MLPIDEPEPLCANDGLDRARLSSYLKAGLSDLSGEIELFRFPSGHANLTYLVKCDQREFVLKCAPPGAKAKSAHDMGREYGVLSKLHGTYPYVPRALLYCSDESVVGGAFCVMERVKGIIIRGQYPHDARITPELIRRQFTSLIEALARLHSIDVTAVGLGDFGRPLGYRQRQLDGWQKRLGAATTEGMADFDRVKKWLTDHAPKEPEMPAVVHNDFKMDNLVWDQAEISKIAGVLDWEMSTVGDPLMDLACTMSFWVQQNDPAEFRVLRAMPSARPEVFSRHEAIDYYSKCTGREVRARDFYLCFGLFRRAVMQQQMSFRYRRGDTQDKRFSNLDDCVRVLRDMCLNVIDGMM
jgi:aminoglycoside phosphotransferase (APT) family kinase protein